MTSPNSAFARQRWIVPALTVLLLVVAAACSLVGSVPISLGEMAQLVAQKMGFASAPNGAHVGTVVNNHAEVLFAIRFPRVLLAVAVGGGLGLSGAAMQGMFRNPLVDPGLLGISSGAALGAVASLFFGVKLMRVLPVTLLPYVLPLAAFVGALVAMGAVMRIARVHGRMVVATLLLAGIAVNAFASALTGLFISTANDTQLRSITFWILGSLAGATPRSAGATALVIGVPLLFLLRFGRTLNTLLLGDVEAGHLGVDVERAKRVVIVLVAFVVGSAVAVSGVLGFVGLAVPHLLRLVVGPDHRRLLPGSALLGASLLLAADAAARTLIAPAELPLGAVTGALGAPVFLALLWRERGKIA
ncbi:MAG: iron ABC transporter permease [Polyangiales bacterium]